MIYLVRHGLSKANVDAVFAGQKDDSPLVEKGFEQAREAGKKIQEMNLGIQKIIASPSIRTRQTADEISKVIGFDKTQIIYDNRIIEYDMGVLTGTPYHATNSLELISAEGAEDPNYFFERITKCIKEYNNLPFNVLFVSHGGVGRMLETIRIGKEPRLFYDSPLWANASVTLIDWVK